MQGVANESHFSITQVRRGIIREELMCGFQKTLEKESVTHHKNYYEEVSHK